MATRRYFYAIEWTDTPGSIWPDGLPAGSVFRFTRQAARDAWVAETPMQGLVDPGPRTTLDGETARRFATYYEIAGNGELLLVDA